MGEIKVIIVEDHPIVRKGFSMLIDMEENMKIVGTAGSIEGAKKLLKNTTADIALIDLTLKNRSAIELIKELKIEKPYLPILVISLHDENIYAERVLNAGARGYVMKSEATESIILAIKQIVKGEIYLSENIKSKMLNKLAGLKSKDKNPVDMLSDRELEVFQMIGEGKTTREIAEELFLSVKTIETYKSHIKIKLGIKDSTELIQTAVEWKVLDS